MVWMNGETVMTNGVPGARPRRFDLHSKGAPKLRALSVVVFLSTGAIAQNAADHSSVTPKIVAVPAFASVTEQSARVSMVPNPNNRSQTGVTRFLPGGLALTTSLRESAKPGGGFPPFQVSGAGGADSLGTNALPTVTTNRVRTLSGFASSSQSFVDLGPAYEDIKWRYKPGELLGPRANPGPLAGVPFIVRYLQRYNPFAPEVYGSGTQKALAHEAEFGEIPSPAKK